MVKKTNSQEGNAKYVASKAGEERGSAVSRYAS